MMYSGFEFLAGNKELRLSRTAKSDADSEDNTDAKGRQQFEELDVDENEFDDSLPIEHPDADEHVEPAIAARFRVCRMVKATFHKDLAFSGRTLEVDECLVTCERMDGGKKFSHIFKLIDWPCGAKLEGRCQDGGSCTAFVY
ncbi:hypothetical protein BV898_02527 [Hypsibius exemplaris]|uniref:Uncharacterized protein n=1 Tax=Hypsibius exemplaris TaxID=2072580 RepID=A0A1W0X8I5_HYPEX|nr:hypothetical protein BV898_02527 [Hypsibius exemplaris]